MKTNNKILAVVLALVLIVGLLPIGAFASDGTRQVTIASDNPDAGRVSFYGSDWGASLTKEVVPRSLVTVNARVTESKYVFVGWYDSVGLKSSSLIYRFNMPDHDYELEARFTCETHTWSDATCMAPKTCSVCGATEGEPDSHNWDLSDDDVEWIWNSLAQPGDDTYLLSAKGTRRCAYGCGETAEMSTEKVTADALQAASCTENGSRTYKAEFNFSDGYAAYTIIPETTVTIPPLGHSWSDVDYIWSQTDTGGWECFATRFCNQGCAVEDEWATVTSEVTDEPTHDRPGTRRFTATFTNPAFETKTKTVDAKAAAPAFADESFGMKYSVEKAAYPLTLAAKPADAENVIYVLGKMTTTGSGSASASINPSGNLIVHISGFTAADVGETITIPVTFKSYSHESATFKVVITLTDKDVPTLSAKDINVTYTGNPVADSRIQGVAEFGGVDVPGAWAFKPGETRTDVAHSGTKTVVFIPADEKNYARAETTLTLTIEKATPTVTGVTVTAPETVYETTAIGDIVLDFTDDPGGGSIKLDDGQTLTEGEKDYNWTYTPKDPANYNTVTGTVSITVEAVPVAPVTVTGIKLNSDNAKKVYTEGDALDVSGLALMAKYSDGSEKKVDVTEKMVSGFDGSKIGKQTVTVTYEDCTDTYEIEVKAKAAVSYAAKDGSGNVIQSVTWQKGSGKRLNLTFHRSADDHLTYGLFGSLEIGGSAVDGANYDAAEGSLKLSIKPEYLETLSVGDHTVKVNFSDGSSMVKLTVKAAADPNVPRTADESNPTLWSGLMFLSVAMLVLLPIARKRKTER